MRSTLYGGQWLSRAGGALGGPTTQYHPMRRTVLTAKREDLAPDVHVAEVEKTWIPVRGGQRERRGMKL